MTAPDIDILIPYEGDKKFDLKVSNRIDILVKVQPLLEQANGTTDPEILLRVADECEKASLYRLAEHYRMRAGIHQPGKADKKREYLSKAIGFIESRGRAESKEIRQYLGISKHEFYPVLTALRNCGKGVFIDLHYVPKSAMLF